MAALLASRRKNLAASNGFHARAESVRLGTPALPRLISALWQSNPPCVSTTDAAVVLELNSLCEAQPEGQGNAKYLLWRLGSGGGLFRMRHQRLESRITVQRFQVRVLRHVESVIRRKACCN